MKYNLDKSYSEFLREVMYENDSFLEKEKKGAKTAEISEKHDNLMKNCKRDLKKKLKSLGMMECLEDGRYKKGNKIVIPVYLQIFFKILILMPSGQKSSIGSKINNGRFIEITDDEIKKFVSDVVKGFDDWDKNIEYELTDEQRKELDKDIIEYEEGKLQIEKLDNADIYNDMEWNYIILKLQLHMHCEDFQYWIKRTFENKRKSQKIKAEIDNMTKKHLDDIFGLKIILNRSFDILQDYSGKNTNLKLDLVMPKSLVDEVQESESMNEFFVPDEEKLFLVGQFKQYLKSYLDDWEKIMTKYHQTGKLLNEKFLMGEIMNEPIMYDRFIATMKLK